MAEEETTRVTMLWPVKLKDQVREEVGARGLTKFALEAVEAKLGTHDAHQADSKELNEVKFLAQRLADAIALGGDYEDRESTLRMMELPDWIQTVGWPENLAAIVKPEDSTPEPVTPRLGAADQATTSPEAVESESLADHAFEAFDGATGFTCTHMVMRDGGGDQCGLPPERHPRESAPVVQKLDPSEAGFKLESVEDDEDLHRPMALTGKPKVGKSPDPAPVDAPTVSLPHDRGGDDLLARIKAKAAEKGVDLDDARLRPASSMDAPEKEAAGADQSSFPKDVEAPAEEDSVTAPSVPEAGPNTCPKCGAELVAGECWECF